MQKVAVAIALLLSLPVMAAKPAIDRDPLDSEMTVFVVETGADGQEHLMQREHADSGQVLEYHLLYKNANNQPLKFTRVQTIVPKGTVYVPGSDRAEVEALFKVSIDGGKTFELEPVKRERDSEQGKETYVVDETAYTHLMWENKRVIRPRQSWLFTFRVKVK